ncbi:mitochondrial import receptor subunit TOM40 homolog 1-like [Venturia canescens]|uniref:mitochondrial import receptor subunit TOM40 homolog 1-like n=1 Tax=Venturia canescens TaxID=32260 RepID=UPI001C9CB1D9|nr:mitochondrial import receptor subunit TOM40 homolog 1-like [Venturia canescens]
MGIVHALTRTSPDDSEKSSNYVRTCVQCNDLASSDPGNPGSFQDIHKKVKDLYPHNFEGGKLSINRLLSNHFRIAHSIVLSPITPSGYKFGAFYEGTTMIGKKERYPSLGCTIMPNGNQTIQFMHTLGCRYRVKFNAQIADKKYRACASELEYRSDNCTMSVSLKNPDFMKVNGTLALYFLQAVSSGLALGVEIACLRDDEIEGQRTIISGAARYSTGPFTVSTTLGKAGLHVCCHRRASEQLQLGAELEVNLRSHESQGTLVYQIHVPKADFTFKGMLDSECTVSGVFEKNLSSIFKSSLLLSGALNHSKGQFRVGIGLNVG